MITEIRIPLYLIDYNQNKKKTEVTIQGNTLILNNFGKNLTWLSEDRDLTGSVAVWNQEGLLPALHTQCKPGLSIVAEASSADECTDKNIALYKGDGEVLVNDDFHMLLTMTFKNGELIAYTAREYTEADDPVNNLIESLVFEDDFKQ